MTRKLQFLLTALLLMVGVTSAWGDDTKLTGSITYDTGVSKTSASTTYDSATDLEIVWHNNNNDEIQMVELMTLKLPATPTGYYLKKAELKLVAKRKKSNNKLSVFKYTGTVNGATYTSVSSNITTALSNKITDFDVVGEYGKDWVSDGCGESYRSVAAWTSTIDLTSYAKTFDSEESFSIMISHPSKQGSSQQFKFFTKEQIAALSTVDGKTGFTAAAGKLVPVFEVTYAPCPVSVTLSATTTYYETFDAAITAALAMSGTPTVNILSNVSTSSRVTCENVTASGLNIYAAEDNVMLSATMTNSILFLNKKENFTLTIGDGTNRLIVDGTGKSNANKYIEIPSKTGAVTRINKVTFSNLTTTNTNGIIHCISGNGRLYLNNVTFDNCDVPSASGIICNQQAGGVTLSGDVAFTNCSDYNLYLAQTVAEDSFTPSAALSVYWVGDMSNGTIVVTSATAANASKYTLTDDYELGYDEGSLKMYYYIASTSGTKYTTFDGAVTAATDGGTVTVLKNCEVASTITFDKSLTITPNAANIVISRSTEMGDNKMFVLATSGKTVTIGDAEKAMTIDGQTTISNTQLFEITNGTLQLTNFTFSNVYTSHAQGVVCAKSSGVVKLTNVAFDGCQATATNAGVVFNGNDNGVILSGNNTFTNCTGYDMCLEKRIKVDETNGVTNTIPIKVYTTKISVGSPVAVTVTKEEIPLFKLMVEGKYLKWRTESQTGIRRDMQVAEDGSESYPLTVSAAGAATLVLPYTTTIPSGAKCYTLSYTNGENITATEITTTLPAHTPVLVVADAGSYTFTKTTAQDPSSNANLLMGLYTALTVPQTTGDNTNYILQNQSGNVGFYKIGESGHSLNANRAYMSVKYVAAPGDPSPALAFFNIGFGGITGISDIEMKQNVMEDENAPIYNLQGVRMNSQNLPKGIYVKNGRKFVIK